MNHVSEITHLFTKQITSMGMVVESNVQQSKNKTTTKMTIFQNDEEHKAQSALCKLTYIKGVVWEVEDVNIGLSGINGSMLSNLSLLEVFKTVKRIKNFKC